MKPGYKIANWVLILFCTALQLSAQRGFNFSSEAGIMGFFPRGELIQRASLPGFQFRAGYAFYKKEKYVLRVNAGLSYFRQKMYSTQIELSHIYTVSQQFAVSYTGGFAGLSAEADLGNYWSGSLGMNLFYLNRWGEARKAGYDTIGSGIPAKYRGYYAPGPVYFEKVNNPAHFFIPTVRLEITKALGKLAWYAGAEGSWKKLPGVYEELEWTAKRDGSPDLYYFTSQRYRMPFVFAFTGLKYRISME